MIPARHPEKLAFMPFRSYSPGRMPWKIDRTHTTTNIVKPAINPPVVHALKVSGMVIRLNRPMDQKPESFGRDSPTPPAQTAIAARTGETVPAAILDDIMEAVVINATVVDPWAQRISWESRKQSSRIGMLKLENTSAR